MQFSLSGDAVLYTHRPTGLQKRPDLWTKIYSRVENATNSNIGNFRKWADIHYMILYFTRHNLRSKTTKHCRTKATGSFSSPGLRKWSWVSSQAAFDYLDFAIRFLGHPEWSLMISGVTKVNLTCRRSQTDLLCETTFCVKHEAPNIGLWDIPRTSATSELPQAPPTGAASSHSERWPAGTPGPGSQSSAIARRDHHFETTYLTPTDGS